MTEIDMATVVLMNERSELVAMAESAGIVLYYIKPSDTVGKVDAVWKNSLKIGVRLIWILDPHWRTITVFQPDRKPTMVNDTQEIDGGDVLPGFRCPVANFFD